MFARWSRTAATAALAAVAGCSVLTVHGPPRRPPHGAIACTEHRTAPAIDFVAAGAFAVTMGAVVAATTQLGPKEHLNGVPIVALGGGAAVAGVSGIYGLVETGRCRAARGGLPPRDGLPPLVETTIRALPATLDRVMIAAGIAKLAAPLQACTEVAPGVSGRVLVRVEVTPEGRVRAYDVLASPRSELSDCVAKGLDGARFQTTQQGGTFTVPFVFGAPSAP